MGGKPSKKGDPQAGIIRDETLKCQQVVPSPISTTASFQECEREAPSNDQLRSSHTSPAAPAPPSGAKPSSGVRPAGILQTAKPGTQAELPMGFREEPVTPAKASSLDVTDDEFTRLVNEAFGQGVAQALLSSKWDRRVEALKDTTCALNLPKMMKGEQLSSKSNNCFRATCLILHRAMRDKVLPVLLESHELLRSAFDHAGPIMSEDDLKEALGSLLPHILVKLGDSNIRLHDSAKGTIIYAAHRRYCGLANILVRLQEHMSNGNRGHMRAKQLIGVVDTVCSLVEQFPGRWATILDDDENPEDCQFWNQNTVWPFIKEGLDDVVFPRTRLRAVELALTVFSTLGRDALTPHIETLRPAVRNLLLQRFEEAEQGLDAPEIEDVTSPRRLRGKLRVTIETPKEVAADSSVARAVTIKPPSTPYASKRPSPRKPKRVGTPAHQNQGGRSLQVVKPSKPSQHWQVVPAAAEEPKWKSALNDHEEDMMDAILEEVGFVFGKSDKVPIGFDEELEVLGVDWDLCRGVPVVCC